jgi:hypothetical protein
VVQAAVLEGLAATELQVQMAAAVVREATPRVMAEQVARARSGTPAMVPVVVEEAQVITQGHLVRVLSMAAAAREPEEATLPRGQTGRKESSSSPTSR